MDHIEIPSGMFRIPDPDNYRVKVLEERVSFLETSISGIVHDIEVDSNKVCGVELDYYLGRLRQLVPPKV
jgi:hypothetical protein